jgi:hypothetical protein
MMLDAAADSPRLRLSRAVGGRGRKADVGPVSDIRLFDVRRRLAMVESVRSSCPHAPIAARVAAMMTGEHRRHSGVRPPTDRELDIQTPDRPFSRQYRATHVAEPGRLSPGRATISAAYMMTSEWIMAPPPFV